MLHIVSGTNRPGARTLELSRLLEKMYRARGHACEVIDLREVGLEHATGAEYADNQHPKLKAACDKILSSEGVVVVCPEYNGSMPGALKYFLDHWPYPDAWEFRPLCLVGLGGRFGGLRPVEHLQQVFGYRNGFVYPERVFVTDVFAHLKDGALADERLRALLESQADGFVKFVDALRVAGLDANSRIARRKAASLASPKA